MKRDIKTLENKSLREGQELIPNEDKLDFNKPIESKTFYIKYEKELSVVDKILLGSLQRKYLYHAIDDILCFSKSKSVEQNNLLALLYSSVLYLQNNLAIDFFDIWINEIYLTKESKRNKFLVDNDLTVKSCNYITLKLSYVRKTPKKKPEPLW